MSPPPPPPRHASPLPSSPLPNPDQSTTWKSKVKATSTVWSKLAVEKSVRISDNLGGKVNDIAEKRFGTEAFWPVTGDFPREMDKCARILRAFTVEGVVTEDINKTASEKKKVKVIRKIPPEVIRQAKGLAIFTSMRSGFAPFGGAGGAGLVVAKLPDGNWSAPASITPNNLSTGFLIGVDVYDCVLVIRSDSALNSFKTHKATLGAEIGVAAGPYGTGAAIEAGLEKAPVFSYVRSRGMYAGVELVGQIFFERFEENGKMYHWPGVKAGDILAGKVRMPYEAAALHKALQDAESGKAQREKGDGLDILVPDDVAGAADAVELTDGEVLKLPPTPEMTDGREYESDPETERVHYPSHPGSHNPSLVDLRSSPVAPPPLPPRSGLRPTLKERESSTSYYSDAEEESPGDAQEAREEFRLRDADRATGTGVGSPPMYVHREEQPPEKAGNSLMSATDPPSLPGREAGSLRGRTDLVGNGLGTPPEFTSREDTRLNDTTASAGKATGPGTSAGREEVGQEQSIQPDGTAVGGLMKYLGLGEVVEPGPVSK